MSMSKTSSLNMSFLSDHLQKKKKIETHQVHRRKRKNRFQQLVRKHILKKKGFNLPFLIGVVHMNDKLEKIFEHYSNLGAKYAGLHKNLWKLD